MLSLRNERLAPGLNEGRLFTQRERVIIPIIWALDEGRYCRPMYIQRFPPVSSSGTKLPRTILKRECDWIGWRVVLFVAPSWHTSFRQGYTSYCYTTEGVGGHDFDIVTSPAHYRPRYKMIMGVT